MLKKVATIVATMCLSIGFSLANAETETNLRQWSYHYDNEGRIDRIDSPQGTIYYSYSAVTGRTIMMCLNQTNLVVRYAYDALGRLDIVQVMMRDGVDVSSEGITKYDYDQVGNLNSVELPNGNYTQYTYNTLNLLTEQVNYQSKPTPSNPNPTELSRYSY